MEETNWGEITKELKCCVVIPTYNNEHKIGKIIKDVLPYTSDLLVVNDGSTDSTSEILQSFDGQIHCINFPKNQGKGKALRTSFKWALSHGFDYVVSMDSDGQHFASDIPLFLEQIKENPNSLVIGARNMSETNVPGKSNFGNNFSNFWFWVETGIKLTDTQSGFRLYPVQAMEKIKYFTNRFEFEVEVIVKAAWKDIDVVNIPIQIHYDPPEERVTHFRPFQDFSRISVLNTYLVTLTLLYYLPKRLLKNLTKKKIKNFLKKNLLDQEEPTHIKALSIGFGVFMGIFPIWGYQLIVGISLAHLLKLNKAIFILAAHISIPPMIPLLIYISFRMGAFFMPEHLVQEFDLNKSLDLDSIYLNLKQYLFGSIAFSFLAGIVTTALSYLIIHFTRKKAIEAV
ncbi:DUF2062 domain-containing protein [Flammeovirgaceae bacterium SG7u.111]|nr:DUF2062 domain-containing protein [Flammeovirgaceae bacterium SG7u.132]WPO36153.1 DUF2062 domain-containing protein [Flammeovirgaceae bacterium SG7u.111]